MDLGFRTLLGCDQKHAHIGCGGLFESFRWIETFRKLGEDVVPVRDMASCFHRGALFCYTGCVKARYGIQVGGNISWSQM